MDIDKFEDSQFAAIAGTYVDTNTGWDFDTLLDECADIYELIYHPKYKKITENARKRFKTSLDEILIKCHEIPKLKLQQPVNYKVMPKKIYLSLINSKYDLVRFKQMIL